MYGSVPSDRISLTLEAKTVALIRKQDGNPSPLVNEALLALLQTKTEAARLIEIFNLKKQVLENRGTYLALVRAAAEMKVVRKDIADLRRSCAQYMRRGDKLGQIYGAIHHQLGVVVGNSVEEFRAKVVA